MKRALIFTVGCVLISNSLTYGAQQRRKNNQKHMIIKSFELKPEEVSDWASHKIDKHVVGLSNRCCCTTLVNYFVMSNELGLLSTKDAIIKKLTEIDQYTERMSEDQISALEKQNSFFNALIGKVLDGYHNVGSSFIRPSNFKALLNPVELFSKTLSPELSKYLGKQVKEKCELWKKYSDLSKVQNNSLNLSEVYSIILEQTNYPLRKESLKMSEDEQYVQAVDISGKTIVWDLQTGKMCQSAKSHVWLDVTLMPNYFNRYITHNSKYRIQVDAQESTLRVYVNDINSVIAELCRIAFKNSEKDNKELRLFSNSTDVLDKLTPFQRICLHRAIQSAIEKNNGVS